MYNKNNFDLEDLNNEKPNTEKSTLHKKSLNDRESKKLYRTTHPETVKEIRKNDNKGNYERNKDNNAEPKYPQDTIFFNKLFEKFS